MIQTETWRDGYVADIPYVSNFYRTQVPDYINFCVLLNGIKPPDINKSFNYCELGSGNGVTSNILAALYPHANFYAIDFNPTHINFSEEIRKKASLENIKFYEMSFEELVKENLKDFPEFEYITLHGVFSWINHENREHIVEFIRKRLKPGGVVYVGYNNMCGWFYKIPLQRFLLDYSKLFPDMLSTRKMKMAIELVKKLKNVGASYFNFPPILKTLSKNEHSSPAYLIHEYLNEDWEPLFFSDVLKYMSKAKLTYCGQTNPIWNFESLIFSQKHIEVLNNVRSMYMREIIKDYMVSMSFRKDIFTKGINSISDKLIDEIFYKETNIVLTSSLEDKIYKIELPYVKKNANIDPNIIDPIFEILADGPKSIGNILEKFKSSNKLQDILPIISMLIHKNIIVPVFRENIDNTESCTRLNRAIARHSRYHNKIKTFAYPIGNTGITATIIERLVFDALLNEGKEDLDDIVSHVYSYLKNFDNTKNESELKEEVLDNVSECIDKQLPLWKYGKLI